MVSDLQFPRIQQYILNKCAYGLDISKNTIL